MTKVGIERFQSRLSFCVNLNLRDGMSYSITRGITLEEETNLQNRVRMLSL